MIVIKRYLLGLSMCLSLSTQAQVLQKRQTVLMGSVFEFTAVGKDTLEAQKLIDLGIAEVDRIENLISEWRSFTPISKVNQQAGITAVKVPKEVALLTQRALEYSKMSQGAFDISIIALDKIWKFDGSMTELPNSEQLKQSIRNVGYEKIKVDTLASTLFLTQKGMKIGFGSIGKGYAADKAREVMKAAGATAGLVNASGDISTWGKPPKADVWKIGVAHPRKSAGVAKIIALKEEAVTTSGSYEKYAEVNGKRYSHIINPKTGMPSTGLVSATVVGPSAEFANALSTSVMVLGKRKGKRLVRKFKDYKCYVIK